MNHSVRTVFPHGLHEVRLSHDVRLSMVQHAPVPRRFQECSSQSATLSGNIENPFWPILAWGCRPKPIPGIFSAVSMTKLVGGSHATSLARVARCVSFRIAITACLVPSCMFACLLSFASILMPYPQLPTHMSWATESASFEVWSCSRLCFVWLALFDVPHSTAAWCRFP